MPARADNIEEAKNHFRHATAAFALGKYADAATEYEAAFELAPDAALLYNAAQAHRLAGNKQRALMLYQSLLRIYGNKINRGEVERRVAELKEAIASEDKAREKPPAPREPSPPPPPKIAHEPTPPPPLPPPPPPPPTATPAPASSAVVARAPEHKRPLAKNPWLWVGIGAGVVVVAGVAIGLGIAFGKSDPRPTFGQVTY